MNNQLDEIIKNKINNYMEQIKVPENLGGIIMEDFEKIKNEETNQTKKTKEEKPKELHENTNLYLLAKIKMS